MLSTLSCDTNKHEKSRITLTIENQNHWITQIELDAANQLMDTNSISKLLVFVNFLSRLDAVKVDHASIVLKPYELTERCVVSLLENAHFCLLLLSLRVYIFLVCVEEHYGWNDLEKKEKHETNTNVERETHKGLTA